MLKVLTIQPNLKPLLLWLTQGSQEKSRSERLNGSRKQKLARHRLLRPTPGGSSRWRQTAVRRPAGQGQRRHTSSTTLPPLSARRPPPPFYPASCSSALLAAAASRTPPAPPAQ